MVEIMGEMMKYYGLSHNQLLELPWLTFISYLSYRNKSIQQEIDEMKKISKRGK